MAEEVKTAEVGASQAQTAVEPHDQASKIIRNHMLTAAGVSLLPFPIIDFAALTGVQMNMLRKMSQLYNIPFYQDKVKNVLSPLIGASIPGMFSMATFSLVKMIPVVGTYVGMATMPVLAGATTYAVGKVFNQHFASGGTFLTFDPKKVKAYYLQMFEEGKQLVAEAKAA